MLIQSLKHEKLITDAKNQERLESNKKNGSRRICHS